MRCKSVVLGAALLLLGANVASAARASRSGSTWLGVSGGAGIPTGDYSDAASTGWHLGVTGTHMLNEQFGIGGDAGYHAWSASESMNDAAVVQYGPGSEYSWNAMQASAHGMMMFPTRSHMKPYAKVGLGVYSVNSKLDRPAPATDLDFTESKLGFNFGGGINFLSSGPTRWGMTAALHMISTEDALGSNANFFTLGVNYLWGTQ